MTTEKDLKDYYDQHHLEKGAGSWRPPQAFPWFLDLVGVRSDDRLLDVGCGTGYLLAAAADRGVKVFGIDLSGEALKLAQEAAPTAELCEGSAESLPHADDSFDQVFCLGAMEHFLNMKKGLSEMIRVTKPGGSLCILVPNDRYWWWLFHRQKGTHQRTINEQMMSLNEWNVFFSERGVRIASVHQDRHWFLHGTRVFESKNPLQMLRVASRKLRWALLPLNHTYQFIFLLEKPEALSTT